MSIDVNQLTKTALLHDLGKLIGRSGQKGDHAELGAAFLKTLNLNLDETFFEMVENHHSEKIEKAELPESHPAFLLLAANCIANGKMTCPSEHDQKAYQINQPLESIFNVVGRKKKESVFYPGSFSPYPSPIDETEKENSVRKKYNEIKVDIEGNLNRESFKHINGVLKLLEELTTDVPSSIHTEEEHDISFYDHAKLTAALAVSLYKKFTEENRHDFKKECWLKKDEMLDEKLFLLVSGDVSGIQDFIYTVAGRGALKSLRGRSFYIEIMVETFIDELLLQLGLSRVNLLYNGGGHFYLLLPNTKEVLSAIESCRSKINDQLLEKFGLNMYLELRGEPCSANELGNDLMHDEKKWSLTGEVFNRVNRQLAVGKSNRYSLENLEQLIDLDSPLNQIKDGEKECAVCKTSSRWVKPFMAGEDDENMLICDSCRGFYELGDQLVRVYQENKNILISIDEDANKGIEMLSLDDSKHYLHIGYDIRKDAKLGFVVNKYAHEFPELPNLWLGNYNVKPDDRESFLMDFKTLAKRSVGIKRIGVLRADVDNLGTLFINGFDDPKNSNNPWRYANFARYATLSRELSQFYKDMINDICRSKTPFKPMCLPGKSDCPEARDLVIVYAGGDDVFIVGAWDQVLEFSLDLRKAFKLFTNDKLTFSGGLAVFPPAYPVGQMAQETGLLEDVAKEFIKDGMLVKNAMVMFGGIDQSAREANRYSWEQFEENVIGEKLQKLSDWFDYSLTNGESDGQSQKRLVVGKGFLYQLISLLREIEENNINIARIAYAIARKEPGEKARREQKDTFADFRNRLYGWIQNPEDVQELITAITIFVYLNRDEKGEENENK